MTAKEATRLRWDPVISAGNVLTAVTLLVGLIAWGLRVEGRVDAHGDRLVRLEQARQRDDEQTAALREVIARLDQRLAGFDHRLTMQDNVLLRIDQHLTQLRAADMSRGGPR